MKPVVFIDDEEMLCRAVRMVLSAAGIPIETFVDPALALTYLDEHEVTAVICDYRMPLLSGLDVLARLPRPVPFYLVSGELEIGHPDGVLAVFEKPFQMQRLVEVARQHAGPET